MNKIHLSFSTINNCLQPENSHCWINKYVLKIPTEVTHYMTDGQAGHEIIQGHVSGKMPDLRIKYIKDVFPIVEEKRFDERCKFSFEIDGYEIIGYFDGLNPEKHTDLEIKLTATTPWTLARFQTSMQRKIYKRARPDLEKSILITGSTNPDLWKTEKLKRFEVESRKQDAIDAEKWIRAGIAVLEDGDYNGGLDEDGRCNLFRCLWGENCHFKHI
jgi:hypothetical protein